MSLTSNRDFERAPRTGNSVFPTRHWKNVPTFWTKVEFTTKTWHFWKRIEIYTLQPLRLKQDEEVNNNINRTYWFKFKRNGLKLKISTLVLITITRLLVYNLRCVFSAVHAVPHVVGSFIETVDSSPVNDAIANPSSRCSELQLFHTVF